jgi:hypothetical protein
MQNTKLVVSDQQLEQTATALILADELTYVDSNMQQVDRFANTLINKVIASDTDAHEVTNAVKIAKGVKKNLEEKKLEATKSRRDEVKTINAFFSQYIDKLITLAKSAEKGLDVWQTECERVAKEKADAEAKAEAEKLRLQAEEQATIAADEENYTEEQRETAFEDAQQSENVAAEIEVAAENTTFKSTVSAGIGTAGRRLDWFAEIEDLSLIPIDILKSPKVTEAIQKVLNAHARTNHDAVPVSGVRFYSSRKTVVG